MAPLQLVNYRSSSVTRTTTETSEMPSRFTRAATVGPTDFKYNYVSAMPFTYQYDCAVQRMLDRNIRATSVAPSNVDSTTYSDAYTRARGGGYSAFDYKVIDYANRLDKEESTRSYINERKYEATLNRASALASLVNMSLVPSGAATIIMILSNTSMIICITHMTLAAAGNIIVSPTLH